MTIKEVNLETFANHGPEMILVYADEIDTVGNITFKTKETFVMIEKETEKVGLTISKDKTKFMYVNRRIGRDRIGQNTIMDRYNLTV